MEKRLTEGGGKEVQVLYSESDGGEGRVSKVQRGNGEEVGGICAVE